MALFYRYSVFCEVEQQWLEAATLPHRPYVCPHDASHAIDEANIRVLDRRANVPEAITPVRIEHEMSPTQGNFQCQGYTLDVPAGTTQSLDLTWPFMVAVLGARLVTQASQMDDVFNCYVGNGVVVGALTRDMDAGADTLYVTESAIDHANAGYLLRLEDTELGMITARYTDRLTCETPSSRAFPAGTLVRVARHTVKNFTIGPAGLYSVGFSTLGASGLPPGIPLTVSYENKGTELQRVYFLLEYNY